jgi:hypothetical protein
VQNQLAPPGVEGERQPAQGGITHHPRGCGTGPPRSAASDSAPPVDGPAARCC